MKGITNALCIVLRKQ